HRFRGPVERPRDLRDHLPLGVPGRPRFAAQALRQGQAAAVGCRRAHRLVAGPRSGESRAAARRVDSDLRLGAVRAPDARGAGQPPPTLPVLAALPVHAWGAGSAHLHGEDRAAGRERRGQVLRSDAGDRRGAARRGVLAAPAREVRAGLPDHADAAAPARRRPQRFALGHDLSRHAGAHRGTGARRLRDDPGPVTEPARRLGERLRHAGRGAPCGLRPLRAARLLPQAHPGGARRARGVRRRGLLPHARPLPGRGGVGDAGPARRRVRRAHARLRVHAELSLRALQPHRAGDQGHRAVGSEDPQGLRADGHPRLRRRRPERDERTRRAGRAGVRRPARGGPAGRTDRMTRPKRLKMKDLERATGVGRETIRFYIREGLLPEPERPGRNVAWYDESFIERIAVVKELQRKRYLPLHAIKALIDGETPPSLAEAETLRAIDGTLYPGARAAAARVSELAKRTGLSTGEIRRLEEVGAIEIVTRRGAQWIEGDAVRFVERWAALRRAGYADALGFGPDKLRVYLDFVRWLAREELRIFAR